MIRILQVVTIFYRELIHIFYSVESQWGSIDDLVEQVKHSAMDAGARAIEAFVEDVSDQLYMSKEMVKLGYHRKERGLRKTLHSSLGDLFLRKDTFQHKDTKKVIAPVLEMLGISAHQRTTTEIKLEAVRQSVFMSFQKAGALPGIEVCKQTVINWLRALPEIERKFEGMEKRALEVLHVFLDEDHLAMLKDPVRKHMILPVGAVAEGHEEVSEGRTRLINPFYFLGGSLKPKDLLEQIEGYISCRYDTAVLKKIYVHGDAASWIQKSLSNFAEVEHVMDGFHFERAIRRTANRFRPEHSAILSKLRKCISSEDRSGADAFLCALASSTADARIQKKTEEFRGYLLSNWDAIVARVKNCPMGSCTEALVQHLASARFSSIPAGWSRETVKALATLRAYMINGGSLAMQDQQSQPAGTYADFMDNYIEELLSRSYDFSIFEPVGEPFCQDTGTQHLIRRISEGGQLAI